MKKSKKTAKRIVEALAVKSAKFASGSASLCGFGQPKEPENIKSILKK